MYNKHCPLVFIIVIVKIFDFTGTAIPIIVEGHETAFNGFQYQFTTGKPVKNLKPTFNYCGNDSTVRGLDMVLNK